jgi:glycosyltransferase involved in cell wall biosynthesis
MDIATFSLGADRRSKYPLAALRLARWLRRHEIDVVHTHLFFASLVGLTAARLARSPLAIFTGHHSHEVPLYDRRLFLEVDRFAARRLADVVVAPSAEMRDTFVNLYGCRADRVEVIEHGVDLARFDPAHYGGDGLRSELGLTTKVVFGAISKHFWIKNLDALVDAFSTVTEVEPDAHLVIIGRGDPSRLRRFVEQRGMDQCVTVLEPRDDIPRLLETFDVFVHPALAESFGFAVIEAMAMALPVVATPVGIARDVIEDGISGLQIAGTSPAAIRDAMVRALSLRSHWSAIGEEARRRALQFSPERWVRAHESLYRRRLESGRSKKRRAGRTGTGPR